MPVAGKNSPGTLIISLDFELHWGVRDVKSIDEYRDNLLGVRQAIPAMLRTFAEYEIHATWATVGLLFFERKSDLLQALPVERPQYDDARMFPYQNIEEIGSDEEQDPFHFARSLLEQIRSSPNQEIGTHTFSHYYCLEPKQSLAAFRADLSAARAAADEFGIVLRSIVFPRNQYDAQHLQACLEVGLTAFRGNPQAWLYRARPLSEESRWLRAARLADSYFNLSSHNCYALPQGASMHDGLANLPASRFLRPYSVGKQAMQTLQERRVIGGLTYAARHGLAYHLWWHPHNFGANLDENLGTLRRILDHFCDLRGQHGMQSKNMAECTLKQASVQEHAVIEEDRFARPRR